MSGIGADGKDLILFYYFIFIIIKINLLSKNNLRQKDGD